MNYRFLASMSLPSQLEVDPLPEALDVLQKYLPFGSDSLPILFYFSSRFALTTHIPNLRGFRFMSFAMFSCLLRLTGCHCTSCIDTIGEAAALRTIRYYKFLRISLLQAMEAHRVARG
jgi:hypothetical protein